MKGTLIALLATASIVAASAFAADKNDAPAPAGNNTGQPVMEMPPGHGPMPLPLPPFPPRKPVLFSATVATDNPAETINKLTALIPTGSAKHYEVRVEVVPAADMP
ncbi:TPA: hypothetical protein I8Y12_002962 [Raoultella planticola]|uniref:hypothetical protein n=1 Tax=Raoultella planticola TaxID=575 RepID=UPI001A34FC94|nr:hypothetical protein [Raoultella planticola]HAT1618487.1 hypothetical protein [Raoultella planticola]HAT1647059.1 hypothetical protein [Raoultella planticola]